MRPSGKMRSSPCARRASAASRAPKTVVVWPELPRSTVGKVLKKDIRAHYWKGRNI